MRDSILKRKRPRWRKPLSKIQKVTGSESLAANPPATRKIPANGKQQLRTVEIGRKHTTNHAVRPTLQRHAMTRHAIEPSNAVTRRTRIARRRDTVQSCEMRHTINPAIQCHSMNRANRETSTQRQRITKRKPGKHGEEKQVTHALEERQTMNRAYQQ
ncbi:hypothetical protein AVEN_114778-1 [Araneus ventricosus]|uniref:Uncharacterized protein n=1 Tax=Araneus ventricosus TaxID=182803 RepID=A0A4Y2W490_ARAVE|nr:hypothetical protein AVEN_114778-1 [Araneus ventricosus]